MQFCCLHVHDYRLKADGHYIIISLFNCEDILIYFGSRNLNWLLSQFLCIIMKTGLSQKKADSPVALYLTNIYARRRGMRKYMHEIRKLNFWGRFEGFSPNLFFTNPVDTHKITSGAEYSFEIRPTLWIRCIFLFTTLNC